MADTISTAAGTTRRVDEDASRIVEHREDSSRYYTSNYYEEWSESYRTSKARVEKIMRKNGKGEMVEDTSRTNVCLPDHFVMLRHGVARVTRNSPNLRLRGGQPGQAEKAAAQLMYQWDRSGAQESFRKINHAAKMLGIGVGKSYYDKVEVTRRFRRDTKTLSREDLMRHQRAKPDDIEAAIASEGPDLQENEVKQAISEHGNSVSLPVPTTKYEGCALDAVFPGDFFPEPGFRTLNESAYIDENSIRDEQWLTYWTKQVSEDPETGEESPVIDEKKAQDLMDMAGQRNTLDDKKVSLRRLMREAVGIADPRSSGGAMKTPRKRFMIDEYHSIVNGRLLIEFVGEESVYLGKLWYPWDTYGEYTYTDMILIPDLIEGIGDSTLRISRFLMQMRNARSNQTSDFINNRLRPMFKTLEGDNWTPDDLKRNAWGRFLTVRDMGEIELIDDPAFPPEAWQDQATLVREMQQVEPGMADYAPGTAAVPQAGKLATTAVLQKQGADAVLADEMNCQGHFTRRTMKLWTYMNQQAMEESLEIEHGQGGKRVDSLIEAISSRTDGANPRTIRIDPMDIQAEFEVMPEEGSTLADDDEYKLGKAVQSFTLAAQHPDVFDKRASGQKLTAVMPGLVMGAPPQPPPPPPPKVGINITAKFEDLAPDTQVWALEQIGAPHEGAMTLGTIKKGSEAIQHIGAAADAAEKLEQPASTTPTGNGGNGRAVEAASGPTPRIGTPKGLGGGKG